MSHRGITVLVLTVLLLGGAIAPAFAQQVPNIANLTPFSAEGNYMSLPGYLRWLMFEQTANWITRAEAVRLVNEQTAAGAAP